MPGDVFEDCALICDRVSRESANDALVVREALVKIASWRKDDPYFADLMTRALRSAFKSGACKCAHELRRHGKQVRGG